jgi:4a-hydroxytetrahydrobiopterin dehydratase
VNALAKKTCIPCRGGVPPLSDAEIAPLREQIDAAWRVRQRETAKFPNVNYLTREYAFGNFAQALDAAVRIGALAEEQQHHPDLHVSWGRLGVEIWTHKIGGLTESDFIFAAKCDEALQEAPGRKE